MTLRQKIINLTVVSNSKMQ